MQKLGEDFGIGLSRNIRPMATHEVTYCNRLLLMDLQSMIRQQVVVNGSQPILSNDHDSTVQICDKISHRKAPAQGNEKAA